LFHLPDLGLAVRARYHSHAGLLHIALRLFKRDEHRLDLDLVGHLRRDIRPARPSSCSLGLDFLLLAKATLPARTKMGSDELTGRYTDRHLVLSLRPDPAAATLRIIPRDRANHEISISLSSAPVIHFTSTLPVSVRQNTHVLARNVPVYSSSSTISITGPRHAVPDHCIDRYEYRGGRRSQARPPRRPPPSNAVMVDGGQSTHDLRRRAARPAVPRISRSIDDHRLEVFGPAAFPAAHPASANRS